MKRRDILLGILLGQLIMLPYVIHLIRTPRVEALTIPSIYYDFKKTQHFEIADIPKGYILQINIASFETVNNQYQRLDPGGPLVNGFYNDRTNIIWCVYDPLVLYHEIKHVTEGNYHR